MTRQHHYQQLILLFDACFAKEYQTRLIKGDEEPVYLPADSESPWHRVVFAHGYYASALHEIAHWCIAGAKRRKVADYGYWYCADGRDQPTQAAFEAAEVKPQALEWMFCVAAGTRFYASCDNLNGDAEPDRIAFQRRIWQQVMEYLQQEMPVRAARFITALQESYGMPVMAKEQFPCPAE